MDQYPTPYFYNPTNHNRKRRARFHNYRLPGTYLITLVLKYRRNLFGTLITDPEPTILHTQLGSEIINTEINKIPKVYPNTKIWGLVVMPDHIHIIIHVCDEFAEGKHLGKVIIGFKSGCNNAYWHIFGYDKQGIFEDGYNDGILYKDGQLENWKRYIADNPRRLAIKHMRPDYFTVMHDMEICGRKCQIVGNRYLLNIPDKMSVVVHRADSDELYERNVKKWLACGERGGVLVSASIAKRENDVMHEAMQRGYRIIYLRENGFPKLYKPSGRTFDACAEGQVLQISPWGYHNDKRPITRSQCLSLNDFGVDIVNDLNSWY